MKNIIIIISLFFLTSTVKADFEVSPDIVSLGNLEKDMQVQFTIDVKNWKANGGPANTITWTLPWGAAPWLEPIDEHSDPYPLNFGLNSYQEVKTITFSGIYDGVLGYQSFYIYFTDSEGITRSVMIQFTGVPPNGIEDDIIVTAANEEFSAQDNLFYEADFDDQVPVGNYINHWFLDLNLFTTEGEVPYVNLENNEYNHTNWSFDAPALDETNSYLWDDQGRVRGYYRISGTDNDNVYHQKGQDIFIYKEPDKSNMRITYTGSNSIKIEFMNSGGVENFIYYGSQAGGPYNGTGIDQGDSPINIGSSTSVNLTGLNQCTNYYITGIASNSRGDSQYWDEIRPKLEERVRQAVEHLLSLHARETVVEILGRDLHEAIEIRMVDCLRHGSAYSAYPTAIYLPPRGDIPLEKLGKALLPAFAHELTHLILRRC